MDLLNMIKRAQIHEFYKKILSELFNMILRLGAGKDYPI